MKHFYRTTDQYNQTDLMIALMDKHSLFEATDIEGLKIIKVPNPKLPRLTQLTLGVMEMCNSLDLVNSVVLRYAPGLTVPFGESGAFRTTFALIFHAGEGVLLNAGDEAVYVHSREVWVISAIDVVNIINKSEDDVFILFVTVRTD